MPGMWDEIHEQPQVIRQTANVIATRLDSLTPWAEQIQAGDIKQVILTGMGGSFQATAPALLQLIGHGVPALAVETSELLYHYEPLLTLQTLVIVVSQSGRSVEIVKLLDMLEGRAPVIGLTNDPDSPLAKRSAVSLFIQAGSELTVSTKTYTCTLVGLHLLAGALTRQPTQPALAALHQLADRMQTALPCWAQQAKTVASQLQACHFIIFLGRGASRASAMTAALITKETAKIPTEGMVGGQFRHGPMEVIAPPVTTVIFASSGRTRDLNVNLARDLAGREGPVVMIGMSVPGALHIAVPSTDEWLTPILEIVPIQMIAAELAAQRGLQVGHFRYGQKVTTTE